MAQLTWRNVDAPNMSGSLDGIRIASGLLGNATDSLSQGLASFGKAQQQRADSAALQGALQYNDPAAYQEALRNGSILGGIDTSQISPETMAALSDRSGQLIDNAGQQQRQDVTGYAFDRTKGQNTATDAARQAVGQFYAAQQNGDQAGANRILQENAGALNNLTPEEQASLYTTGGDLQGKRLSNTGQGLINTGRGISNNRDQFSLDSDRQALADQTATKSLINDIMGSVLPGDADGARAAVERNAGNLSVNALNMLRQSVGQAFPGAYSASPGSSAPVSGATTNPYDMVYGNGQYGTPPKPPSQMTIGEVQDFGKNSLIPATRGQVGAGADKGTSATGAFQITQGTLDNYAPKVFGDNWKNTQFTPENQEKLAQAIYEDNKNGDLSKIWTSLPNSASGAYKDVPWSQMRTLIASGESGPLPASVTTGANDSSAAAQLMLADRAAQNTSQQQWVNDLPKSQTDNRPATDVVDTLLKGALKGTDRGYLLDQVNRVVAETGYTPSTAANMITSNLESRNNIFQRAGHSIRTLGGLVRNNDSTPDLGGGVRFNDTGLNNAIEQAKTGVPYDTAFGQMKLGQQSGTVQQAQTAFQQAVQQYNELQRRLPTQPGLASQVDRYRQNVNRAQANLTMILGAQAQNPNMRRAQDNQPVPVPVPPQPIATSVGDPQAGNSSYVNGMLQQYQR